ncbi:MAG: hypothetical protein A2593_05380 [Candidatus Moranbacteria bacterium RIFOXYD1_FULL_44_9]|nr:MAG: hypothetical protein A2593_05380 [Candidatus Moranbacteria bacterium RIFOXYD1_FULL_44_9]
MPGSTTSRKFHWVYVLLSLRDRKRYIGYTIDLRNRFEKHRSGKVISTRHRRPLIPIYIEGCLNLEDARRREKYFKTTGGRRFLATRLKIFYKE